MVGMNLAEEKERQRILQRRGCLRVAEDLIGHKRDIKVFIRGKLVRAAKEDLGEGSSGEDRAQPQIRKETTRIADDARVNVERLA